MIRSTPDEGMIKMAEKIFTFLCYGSSLAHVKDGNTTPSKVKKNKEQYKKI